MITLDDYAGVHKDSPDWTEARMINANDLLYSCAKLERLAVADGVVFKVNPKTGTEVSGETLGGFRPQSCKIGAPSSAHKEGLAVDRYDPDGAIDSWCMINQDKLRSCGIYLEHPTKTIGWSHWTIRRPKSGNRVFMP